MQQQSPKNGIRLSDAIDAFLVDCEARRLTEASIVNYRRKLKPFTAWCSEQDVHFLHDITPTRLRQFLIAIGKQGHSDNYQNNIAGSVRRLLNFLVEDEVISVSPFAKVKMPKLAKRILPAFSPDELRKIIQAAKSERDKALVMTLVDCGVRASELCALTVGDVDLNTGMVSVRAGKGRKDRNTYIGVKTRKEIRRYLRSRRNVRESDALFQSMQTGMALTVYGLNQLLRRIGRAAGVKNCTAHSFRRTFALESLRGGMSIHVLAKLMGHADISVLRRYLDLVEDDLQDAHRRAGPVDHMK